MTLAVAKDATKRFGDVTAVDRVNVRVQPGEVVGLLGANGAGKTTLIRMLLGLIPPTAGVLRLFGEAPSRRTRRRLGYVPQDLGLYEDLTVGQNLSFAASAYGTAEVALDPELEAARGQEVRDLPRGVQRRVAFAKALAHGPGLLVLDEPTSGVDPLGRARLWETIRGAAESGAGILVTTHHMEEAEQCDRLVVMAGGRVVAAGTMAEIVGGAISVRVTAPRWEEAYAALSGAGEPVALVGRTLRVPGGDAGRVRDTLEAARVSASLEVEPATLEEAFVELSAGRRG